MRTAKSAASHLPVSKQAPAGRSPHLPTVETARNRGLSERELYVCGLVHLAYSNRQIAKAIGAKEESIKVKMREIFDKLGFWNRVELALWYEVHHCDGKCLTNL